VTPICDAPFAAYARANIRPDGHGIWQVDDQRVGFFREHDNNTEDLPRVIAKLAAYEYLASFGPRYTVLPLVPDRRRETALLRALHGTPTPMPVATAVHSCVPAGPVWALAGVAGPRLRLHELPNARGLDPGLS
jgi:hypothetical protein